MIDFGSSCFEHQRVYTYIQSRFYRAPEVILGGKYGLAIDVWSLGCILAELLTGYPLLPGEDESDQLACIIELLGMPPQRLLDASKRTKNFFTSKGYPRYAQVTTYADGEVVLSGARSRRGRMRGPPGSGSFTKVLRGCEDLLFVDFLKRCLEWEPSARITPSNALRHPWLRRRLPRPPAVDVDTSSSAATSTTPLTAASTLQSAATTSATGRLLNTGGSSKVHSLTASNGSLAPAGPTATNGSGAAVTANGTGLTHTRVISRLPGVSVELP